MEGSQEWKCLTFSQRVQAMEAILPVGKSFDVMERVVSVGERETYLYFIDGFIKDDVMQRILTDFFKITAQQMAQLPQALDFVKGKLPYVEVSLETDCGKAIDGVLSGQTAMLMEGYPEMILMDLRTYPVRSVGEPEKEKTLRGARDGLVETIVFNTALLRRRIRDPRLVFSMHSVGSVSKTDVCVGYMEGMAEEGLVKRLMERMDQLDIKSLTVGDQSLVEALGSLKEGKEGKRAGGSFWNPFPKVRYTERPDVAAAHLAEGKFVILVDNSPTAIILPTGFFDFLQDVDDYYFPVITGNYFRLIRNFTLLLTSFMTPLYLMAVMGAVPLPRHLWFLLPQEPCNIPLFWQFLLLELAIDGLKLASLNTPSSLGMSLSVIGALILGDFSVTVGWFIPQAILLMAVVALAGFAQPSIELNYAVKFMRIALLIGTAVAGLWGFVIVLGGEVLILCTTKTITGTSYLYPLIPFDGNQLMGLLFRIRVRSEK